MTQMCKQEICGLFYEALYSNILVSMCTAFSFLSNAGLILMYKGLKRYLDSCAILENV